MRLRDWDTNLKIRLAGESVVNISFWMFFPFLAIYFSESFGKTTAGLLLIFSQFFAVVANLFGGYCADRFGRKRMMVISTFGQGIAYIFFAWASSPWLDSPSIGFISFTAVSIFSAFYNPASQAMVADVIPEKDRSGVFAVFYTSINIAVVIGPILGGIFYATHRFELLALAAIINILLGFILQTWVKETALLSIQEKGSGKRVNGFSFLLNQLRDYQVIFRDKVFLLFIIAGVLVYQTFMQLDLLFPVYINEMVDPQSIFSITLQEEQIFGFLLAENGLFVALLTITVTKWASMYKERNIFIISSLIYSFSMILFGATQWVWGLFIAIALFSIAELLTAGIQQGFVSKLAPAHMRGQYFAASSLRFTIGRMLAPLAIPMTGWIGYNGTFLMISILAVLSAVLYFIMFSLYEKTKVQIP
ncbi:MDR family MFS transporter [Peribacillus sp. NPDC097224]|uniref:MDR family MFS transporter n=1 Tax=Peribacillus sp. NPDC097224 TaxID=3364399 RepID=UPI0037FC8D56